MKRIILFMLAVVFVSSCNTRPSETGESGELGRGVFYYKCVNHTFDSACHDNTTPDFPGALAVGARFDMEFSVDLSDGYDYLRVIPGSPNHISESAGVLTLQKNGFSSIFSVSGPFEVVDIVHVLGMPIADISLVPSSWDGGNVAFEAMEEIRADIGEEIELRAVAVDKYGRTLAGLIEYAWSVEDERIAVIGSHAKDSVLTLVGERIGKTQLSVLASDIEKQYEIIIGDYESDTETDSDTEVDTEMDADDEGDEFDGEQLVIHPVDIREQEVSK